MLSLSYVTAATSLNIKDYEEIKRPVVNAILPKMGINRNTSKIVVSGTSKYGILGIDHLAVVQGLCQLQYMIESLRTQYNTGYLYQMLLGYTQIECDTSTTLLLEANFARYEHVILTKNWIKECWRYLTLCNSSVTISGPWSPMKGRLRDASLMNEFTRHISAILLHIGYNRSGRKVHRRLGKTKKTTSKYKKQVELAGPKRPPTATWRRRQLTLQGIAS
jgi:hypothetical protein